MSGINRLILADLARSKPKGKALSRAVGKAFSPSAIAKKKVEKQPLKKKKK